MKEIEIFTKKMLQNRIQVERQIREGDVNGCRSMGGIFQVKTDDNKNETWRFSPIESDLRNVVWDDEISQIYFYHKLNPKSQGPAGVMIEKGGKLFLVERSLPVSVSSQFLRYQVPFYNAQQQTAGNRSQI